MVEQERELDSFSVSSGVSSISRVSSSASVSAYPKPHYSQEQQSEAVVVWGRHIAPPPPKNPSRRELGAWVLVLVQSLLLVSFIVGGSDVPEIKCIGGSHLQTILAPAPTPPIRGGQLLPRETKDFPMNGHPQKYYSSATQAQRPYYEPPEIHRRPSPAEEARLPETGLVSRAWHSNGSPFVNSDLKGGSCWCSEDQWCMCTPAMAVDVVLTDGTGGLWLVKRGDTGQLALMGGMVEVGETPEEAVRRELREEMNVSLDMSYLPPLIGVYGDPLRDARRHSASIVYEVRLPLDQKPCAGDDAIEVVRLAWNEIAGRDFFVDHATVIRDFIRLRSPSGIIDTETGNDGMIRRSICQSKGVS